MSQPTMTAGEASVAARPPAVVDSPCRHYGADALHWPARPELEAFQRATYQAHIAAACRRRHFVASLPREALAPLPGGQRMRREAVPELRRLLRAATADLARATANGDPLAVEVVGFGVTSAYRSALDQYRLWNDRFPRYFAQTADRREHLPGGPTGAVAAQWLAHWIGVWLAAPGFSNHNDGRAVDLACRLRGGRRLAADRADIDAWRSTWLYRWLCDHAADFDFVPYDREPWHWEHRPAAARPASEFEAPGTRVPALAAATAPAAAGVARYWQEKLGYGYAGNAIQPLIDGPDTFRAIKQAIETATGSGHFVYLLAWWLDPWLNLDGPKTCLLDLLEAAGNRDVQIRGLVWNATDLIYPGQSKLNRAAAQALSGLRNCVVQQDGGRITKSHHQKLVVVNGEQGLIALCGGVDINADRVACALPPPPETFRRDRPDVGWNGTAPTNKEPTLPQLGIPFHDVHARLTGPTALPFLRIFLRRWYARSGERGIDRKAPLRATFASAVPARAGQHFVRVGETFTDRITPPTSSATHSRARTVQDIWLRSILAARRYIYIEDQYLVNLCAAQAIRQVLPQLDHVTVLIPAGEISDLMAKWGRRKEFIDTVTAGLPPQDAARFRVFTLTSPGDRVPRCSGNQREHTYVHAKIGVVDDEVMLIGSANCNNRGWESDSELVFAGFEDRGGPQSIAGRLRVALWAHHLCVPEAAVQDPLAAKELWRTAGSRRVSPYLPTAGRDGPVTMPLIVADPRDMQPDDPCRKLIPAHLHPK